MGIFLAAGTSVSAAAGTLIPDGAGLDANGIYIRVQEASISSTATFMRLNYAGGAYTRIGRDTPGSGAVTMTMFDGVNTLTLSTGTSVVNTWGFYGVRIVWQTSTSAIMQATAGTGGYAASTGTVTFLDRGDATSLDYGPSDAASGMTLLDGMVYTRAGQVGGTALAELLIRRRPPGFGSTANTGNIPRLQVWHPFNRSRTEVTGHNWDIVGSLFQSGVFDPAISWGGAPLVLMPASITYAADGVSRTTGTAGLSLTLPLAATSITATAGNGQLVGIGRAASGGAGQGGIHRRTLTRRSIR